MTNVLSVRLNTYIEEQEKLAKVVAKTSAAKTFFRTEKERRKLTVENLTMWKDEQKSPPSVPMLCRICEEKIGLDKYMVHMNVFKP